MSVQVDQPRGNVQAARVDHAERQIRGNVAINRRDPVAAHGHVAASAQTGCVVDHLSALDQQVKLHRDSPSVSAPTLSPLPLSQHLHVGHTGHQPDQLRASQVGPLAIVDLVPETQHDDPVGHAQHLLHVVADEDDRDPVALQALDEGQHDLSLLDAERGGRLVEQNDPAAPQHRPGDSDRLPLAAG